MPERFTLLDKLDKEFVRLQKSKKVRGSPSRRVSNRELWQLEKVLTGIDGKLATSDQTIESGESRRLSATNTTFTLKSSNVSAVSMAGLLFRFLILSPEALKTS